MAYVPTLCSKSANQLLLDHISLRTTNIFRLWPWFVVSKDTNNGSKDLGSRLICINWKSVTAPLQRSS